MKMGFGWLGEGFCGFFLLYELGPGRGIGRANVVGNGGKQNMVQGQGISGGSVIWMDDNAN